MTAAEWWSIGKDVVMGAVVVLVWFMGRERKQIDKDIASLDKRVSELEDRVWDLAGQR